MWVLFKVMLRKNISLGWKRKRFRSLVWSAAINMGILILLYRAISGDAHDHSAQDAIFMMVGGMIVPFWLTQTVWGTHSYVVTDCVAEKASRMKVLQEIHGVPSWMLRKNLEPN